MVEQKNRNGIIAVNYLVSEFNGKLSKIGFFRETGNREIIVFRTKPEEGEYFPLYLEIRAHRIFSKFIGQEIQFTGYLTVNRTEDGQIKSAHITPTNWPLMQLLYEQTLFSEGQKDILEKLKQLKHKLT